MQGQIFRILGLLVFSVVILSPNSGFADGWTWGPFSKSNSSRDSSPLYNSSSTTQKSSWLPTMKMPKMPWSSSGPKVSSYSRSNTSTWGKMTKASKRWWSKTTEMLDPYPDPKPSTYVTNSDPKSSKPGFFQSLFKSKEPEGPRTADEFFRQESLK